MSAREQILARISAANSAAGVVPVGHAPDPVTVTPGAVEEFVATVADYRAQVVRTPAEGLSDCIAQVVAGLGIATLLVPEGLERAWLAGLTAATGHTEPGLAVPGLAEPGLVEQIGSSGPERKATVTIRWVQAASVPDPDELDAMGGTLTGATLGIARTGTIVLDHGSGQGPRALTLVPDVHVCVIRADQLVADVPDAVARLAQLDVMTGPLTWISGPSATSDIELSRVEGVHGPRTLHVVLAE